MSKRNQEQRRSFCPKHESESWKSGGGHRGSFPKYRWHKREAGTWKTKHVGQRETFDKRKQLPFGQNTMKEDEDKGKNIEGHSGEVGLHARTRSTTNDKESTTLRSSGCFKGRTLGHKEKNEK